MANIAIACGQRAAVRFRPNLRTVIEMSAIPKIVPEYVAEYRRGPGPWAGPPRPPLSLGAIRL
jgi:hypothetical protein